ncbi:hypothetical protein DRN93_01395 [archaeon]|nr:MAG: hypothetical protein DRN93_01395 [archaeon]
MIMLKFLGYSPMHLSQWLKILESRPSEFKLFGEAFPHRLKEVLETFWRIWGDRRVYISRSPGRVNVFGRHMDYMGGWVNSMAIEHDVITVVEPRRDYIVNLFNVDKKYSRKSFNILEELPEKPLLSLEEWDQWTSRRGKELLEKGVKTGWEEYVKGLYIYLWCKLGGDIDLKGANILVSGNIPPARGLSSSSALVVSLSLALWKIYNIEMPLDEFIETVGYSEWFRLTRGGVGDHAAMFFARRGKISHIGFHPLDINKIKYSAFPDEYKVIVIDSGYLRPQTREARNYLRVTAAEYRLSLIYVKSIHPEYAEKLMWLRDLNPRTLGISLQDFYRIILEIPLRISRDDLLEVGEEYSEELHTIFSNHIPPKEGYKLRSRCLFGVSEAERAILFPRYLETGEMNNILRLIEVSHDGDRVSKFDEDGERVEWDPEYSCHDAYIKSLIKNLNSDDPLKVEAAQLHWVPGSYERSIPPIDYLCDMISYRLKGSAAAQLMGAGLGGNVLAIVHKDKVKKVEEVVNEYSEKFDVKTNILLYTPGEGAALL